MSDDQPMDELALEQIALAKKHLPEPQIAQVHATLAVAYAMIGNGYATTHGLNRISNRMEE